MNQGHLDYPIQFSGKIDGIYPVVNRALQEFTFLTFNQNSNNPDKQGAALLLVRRGVNKLVLFEKPYLVKESPKLSRALPELLPEQSR
jgi:hypothetical protein